MAPTRARTANVVALTAALAVIVGTAAIPVPRYAPADPVPATTPSLDTLFASQAPTAGAPESETDRVAYARSGILRPGAPITVANLTVRPGQYIVGYTFEADLRSAGSPGSLTCGVLDSNGRNVFLIEGDDDVIAGAGWERRSVAASLALPDMTIGLRCVPDGAGLAVASFRDIRLAVTRVPRD